MAGPSAAEIDALGVETFGIRREQNRCGVPEWKGHAKCDEREVTVEHHRAVYAGERSEFFGNALGFSQKRISKKAAECHVGRAQFPGTDGLRATETARQPDQRCHR